MLSEQPSSYPYEVHSPFSSDTEEDYRLSHPPLPPMIPLTDLCTHFPDLPSFVHHPDFDHFAYCWMEFQYHMAMSQYAACRPGVRGWLASMSVQLSNLVAKYPPPPPSPHVAFQDKEDHEASTTHIKFAYRRLVHRFGVLHKLLDMIDHGPAVGNQSPQEIVLPVYNTLLEYKLDRQNHRSPYRLDPFSLTSSSASWSSSSSSSSSSGTSTPIVQLSLLSLSASPEPATTTSSFRSLACMEVMPYLNDSCAPSPHIHPMSLVLPSPSRFVHTPLTVPQDHHHHQSSSWSTPVTPSTTTTNENTPTSKFWSSCPVSPLPAPAATSTSTEEPVTPLDTQVSIHEDEISSEYQPEDEDDSRRRRPTKSKSKKRRPSRLPTPTASPPPPTRRHTRRRRRRGTALPLIASAPTTPTSKIRPRGRTATSYDQDTTRFLKSMFFNVYSQRDKLTKEQRRQVVERTGLKPRNVTYWFSNHKRRFQSDLDVFRKLMAESDGRIRTYDDYVAWRREQGLPEEMMGDSDM